MQSATEQNSEPDQNAAETANRRWIQSVGQRLLTAFIAMALVLICLWFGGWWTFAGTALVVVLATFELYNMTVHAGYRPLFVVSLGLNALFLVAAMLPQSLRLLVLEIGLGASLLISFPWLFFRKKLDGALVDWALTLALPIYLGWSMSFFPLLRGYDPGSLPGVNGAWLFLPRGAWWLLLVLLGVWGFDTAAFFTGHFFGRHKLAPAISPGKTWEGVIGGMVLSIAVSLVLTVGPLGVPWYLAIVLGILLGVAAVSGDLAESLIKRQTHVKDSGQIMPGHGGMLDRIDSLIFAVIVVYVFAQIIGK